MKKIIMKGSRSSKSEPHIEGESLKKSIIKTRNIIRKKFQDLHNHKLTIKEQVNETFKPIIEPLETLVKKEKVKQEEESDFIKLEKKIKPTSKHVFSPSSVLKPVMVPLNEHSQQFENNISSVSSPFDDVMEDENLEHSIIEKVRDADSALYGFQFTNGKLLMGRDAVRVKDGKAGTNYHIKNRKFSITHGLTELLLSNNPKGYTGDDLNTYKKMLEYTSAHKSDFNSNGDIIRNPKNQKYNKIISGLFPPNNRKSRLGGSLKKLQTKYKMLNGKNTSENLDYVYWDDPNELVDRLRLLTASQTAGHTGHNNEIISIIEELREAKIIK